MTNFLPLLLLPLLGLLSGVWMACNMRLTITEDVSVYMAVGLMVTVNVLFEGTAQFLDGRFRLRAAFFDFLLNMVFACFLLTIGYLLHVDLYIALFIVFGIKLFSNLSNISQKFFSKISF